MTVVLVMVVVTLPPVVVGTITVDVVVVGTTGDVDIIMVVVTVLEVILQMGVMSRLA